MLLCSDFWEGQYYFMGTDLPPSKFPPLPATTEVEARFGPNPTHEQKLSVYQRYSLASSITGYTDQLARAHSLHFQASVHSHFYFRSRFCVQLAEQYAILSKKVRRSAVSFVFTDSNSHRFLYYIDLVLFSRVPSLRGTSTRR